MRDKTASQSNGSNTVLEMLNEQYYISRVIKYTRVSLYKRQNVQYKYVCSTNKQGGPKTHNLLHINNQKVYSLLDSLIVKSLIFHVNSTFLSKWREDDFQRLETTREATNPYISIICETKTTIYTYFSLI